MHTVDWAAVWVKQEEQVNQFESPHANGHATLTLLHGNMSAHQQQQERTVGDVRGDGHLVEGPPRGPDDGWAEAHKVAAHRAVHGDVARVDRREVGAVERVVDLAGAG